MSKPASGCILLVDHSRGSLLFQESILRRREATVATALTGSAGLEIARNDRPQLIMFAFDLFDMTAPEFCREIRADASTRMTSLLLVCERESPEHADLCLSAGCNDVIFRPLQRHELDGKVGRLTAIPSRRELRTLTRIEVSVEKNGRFIIGRSINISASGMLIEVDHVLPGRGSCGYISICRAIRNRCSSKATCCARSSPAERQSTGFASSPPTRRSANASSASCGGCARAS